MENVAITSDYAVEMLNISKSFDGVFANKDISLQLKRGEIHALLGENGAGKSTLMNVLFGLINPDSGEIKINGKSSTIRTPNDASALGIGMVHQHFMLIDIFTVLQNIILGDEPKKGCFVSMESARKKVTSLMEKYGLSVDLDAKVADISVGMQQRVEILKMLYRDNQILIFDEPTAVLTPQETDELLNTMKMLVSKGCSILFITHHMDEIFKVADRCTILSQGKWIDTLNIADTTKEELSRKMVGREVKLTIEKSECHPGEKVLDVKNLCVSNRNGNSLKNVSFEIKKGEIVCIAGIDGNGQAELVGSITGMQKVKSGTIKLEGKDITNMSIRRRSISGISHIPEDRLKHGIIGEYSVEKNLILQRYFDKEFSSKIFGFFKNKNIDNFAEKLIDEYDIRLLRGQKTKIGGLSGGNQQKVVVARELEKDPKLLVAVQPVRGVDVGSTEYIHDRLIKQRDDGCAILLVSFELEEATNLSDRILVMFDGEIVAEFKSGEVDANELGLYMAGGKKQVKGENA